MLVRFQNEARAAATLQHENIITIFEFGEYESNPYIVMEYLEGEDLEELIRSGRQVPIVDKVQIMTQVAKGLHYAHTRGFVHRDVKPANIRILEDGAVKIMDFGLARLLQETGSRLTQTGSLLGTAHYVAPESLFGKESGFLSDIYAYGTVYYEFLSGKHPFAASDVQKTFYNILNLEPKPLSAVVKDCPKEIEGLVQRAMAKDPKDRYQTLDDLLRDSAPILQDLRGREAAELVEQSKLSLASGNPEAALFSVERALKFEPNRRDARALRDSAAQRLAARTIDQRVEALREAASQAIDRLDLTAAESEIKQALELSPKDPVVAELLRHLEKLQERQVRRPTDRSGNDPSMIAAQAPPLPNDGEFNFTQRFSTKPGSNVPPPASNPSKDSAPVEYTGLFVVPPHGGGPESMSTADDDIPRDTILTVSNCARPEHIGLQIGLRSFPFTIGRSDADWKLTFDSAISSTHAEIDYRDGGFFIRDLNSSNGTFVSGQRLAALRYETLLVGSRILLGSNTEVLFGVEKVEELPDLKDYLVGHRFKLLELLHSTNKSVLYLAKDQNLPRQVVLKLLSPTLVRHAGYREQFSREATMATSLKHAHICQVLDSGEFHIAAVGIRTVYVCMEYLPGGSLQKRLTAAEVVPLDQALRWLDTISEALSYVHTTGIVHAGIKPSAIVFDAQNNPYLTDFAFAVRTAKGERRMVIGSPAFLAPEQWDGAEPSAASDQYSLAVLFYWLIAGVPPFEGQEHSAVRKRNLQRGPDALHEVAAQYGRLAVPAGLSHVFKRALSVDPSLRFESAAAFAKSVRSALTASGARAGPPSVFISYQRTVSSAWAILLKRELERDGALQVFVDAQQEDSTGQFPLKLQRWIEGCDVFICLLAGSTLSSAWVKREIQLAWEQNKPMIPVFQESYRKPPDLAATETSIQDLLTYEGVKLLDQQNIFIDEAIRKVIASTHHAVQSGPSSFPHRRAQAMTAALSTSSGQSNARIRRLLNQLSNLFRGLGS
jgi:serine/threonine protein kinase